MSGTFRSDLWYRVAALQPRLSPHAAVQRHRQRGQAWYVLADRAANRVHRFPPPTAFVLGLMDGHTRVDTLWRCAVEAFGDAAPSQDELIRLLAQLHAADLLVADTVPDLDELLRRHRQQRAAVWRRRFANPLAWRLPLLDPDAFLGRTLAHVRWLCGPLGVGLWLLAVLPAAALAAQHWNELSADIAGRVLSAQGLLTLWLVYPVVKALHELGHAYLVKAGGGEVHELGLMLLVFAPVPYVDASAAAAFRSRRRRAAVGAAGILVELFLAALAMYAWVLVEPGPVRAIAFNVMLIAGVSTVLLNGNPLLRYDGYYVLCDLIDIPNLGQRANRYYGWLAQRYLCGARELEAPRATHGERAWFLFYAPAAWVYRIGISIAIALFLAQAFFFVGVVLALWCLVGLVVLPVAKAAWHLLHAPELARHRGRALAAGGGGVVLLAALLFLLPVPAHTLAEGVVWVPEQAELRAAESGFVRRLVLRPGEWAEPGATVIETDNPEFAAAAARARARVIVLEVRHAAEQFQERTQAAQTREALAAARREAARAEERLAELGLRAQAAGRAVIPAAVDLPGRFLRKGELVGHVLPADPRTVRVVVAQDDIERVRGRVHEIEVRLVDRPAEVFRAQLVREVPSARDTLPSRALALDGGGPHVTDPRDRDGLRTLNRLFQFDLTLPAEVGAVHLGTRALVRYGHAPEPLGLQWARRLRQLFLARLDV